MVGWQVLSRPSAAEGGGRRTAFTGPAIQPYSATEVDGWQHELSRVSQNRAAVQLARDGESGDPGARMWDACKLLWLLLIGLFRSRASLEVENLALRQRIIVLSLLKIIFARSYDGVLTGLAQ